MKPTSLPIDDPCGDVEAEGTGLDLERNNYSFGIRRSKIRDDTRALFPKPWLTLSIYNDFKALDRIGMNDSPPSRWAPFGIRDGPGRWVVLSRERRPCGEERERVGPFVRWKWGIMKVVIHQLRQKLLLWYTLPIFYRRVPILYVIAYLFTIPEVIQVSENGKRYIKFNNQAP